MFVVEDQSRSVIEKGAPGMVELPRSSDVIRSTNNSFGDVGIETRDIGAKITG